MPRTFEVTAYKFEELSESAKEKAREWGRNLDFIFGWSEESKQSIVAFCDHFGVTLTDWSVGPWSPFYYQTDAENSHFRGVKLKSISPDNTPTGYCLDHTLWETFHREFKRSGDAKYAFNEALYAGFKAWRADWESAYEDAQLDEFLIANEYEFTEDGKRL